MPTNHLLNNTYILNFLIGLHLILGGLLFYFTIIDSTDTINYDSIRYFLYMMFITIILISKRATIKKQIENKLTINSNTLKVKNLEMLLVIILMIIENIYLMINGFNIQSFVIITSYSIGTIILIYQRNKIIQRTK